MSEPRTAEIKEDYALPLWKFLNIIHGYTQKVEIYVVSGYEGLQDNVRDFYLTKDAFDENGSEGHRLLTYYADVPVWNVTADIESVPCIDHLRGDAVRSVLVARCHYKDLREAYFREREDIKKAKQKAYREKRKAENR